jgi:hypothetical protein
MKTGMQRKGIPIIGVKHCPPCTVIDFAAKTILMTTIGISMIAAKRAIINTPNPCHRLATAQI